MKRSMAFVYAVIIPVILILFAKYINFLPNSLTLVPAFLIAFLAFITGNYTWHVITSPVLEIKRGKSTPNGSTNTVFYPVFIKNSGRTSCKNALIKVYLKNESSGETIEFTPKWASSPEPFTRYFFERAPGSNGKTAQVRINSEGLSPTLLANMSQTVSIPPMPKGDQNFAGERADLFFWDMGGQFALRLVGESGTTMINAPPGVKKFSPFDFYLNRGSSSSALKSADYNGTLYIIADDYCGACKIILRKWEEPDFTTAQPGDLLSASDKFQFSLSYAKIKGVKSIKVTEEGLEG
ncbi:MAG: hypothetical protein KIS30_04070 [Thermoplasmata archaeon]|nr:hypothetical protein [Candidatus Sysuiplasma acidicola]